MIKTFTILVNTTESKLRLQIMTLSFLVDLLQYLLLLNSMVPNKFSWENVVGNMNLKHLSESFSQRGMRGVSSMTCLVREL